VRFETWGGGRQIWGRRSSDTQFQWLTRADPGNFQLSIGGPSSTVTWTSPALVNILTTGTWHHVAATYSASNGIHVDANGTEITPALTTVPSSIRSTFTSTALLTIGAEANFNGSVTRDTQPGMTIDHAAIWAGFEASAAQVAELRDSNGHPVDPRNTSFIDPNNYWPFEAALVDVAGIDHCEPSSTNAPTYSTSVP
jgi:hypothetical protein